MRIEVLKHFKPFIKYEGMYAHTFGGAGSGKSRANAQKVLYRCLKEQGHRFMVLRKIGRTARDSTFIELQDAMIAAGIGAKINRVEPTGTGHTNKGA